MNSKLQPIIGLLQCPRCHSDLVFSDTLRCGNRICEFSILGFPIIREQPCLIDFEHSVFEEKDLGKGANVTQAPSRLKSLVRNLSRFSIGDNSPFPGAVRRFLKEAKDLDRTPKILIIGGGTLGAGIEPIRLESAIDVITSDVYLSEHTDLLCDGHHLPFRRGVFHGVLIQAVLEHVLDPLQVVKEIHESWFPMGLFGRYAVHATSSYGSLRLSKVHPEWPPLAF